MGGSKVVTNYKILLTSNNIAEFKLNYLKTKENIFRIYLG